MRPSGSVVLGASVATDRSYGALRMARSGAEAVDVYSLLPRRAHEASRMIAPYPHNPAHILPTNDDGPPAKRGSTAA